MTAGESLCSKGCPCSSLVACSNLGIRMCETNKRIINSDRLVVPATEIVKWEVFYRFAYIAGVYFITRTKSNFFCSDHARYIFDLIF